MPTNLQHAIALAVNTSADHEVADPITAVADAATAFFKEAYAESDGDFAYVLFKAKQEWEADE